MSYTVIFLLWIFIVLVNSMLSKLEIQYAVSAVWKQKVLFRGTEATKQSPKLG